MENETVIKVNNVSKDFVLVHEKSSTVKGIFTSMFRKATIKKETQHALKNISLEIKKGEFFGIVGRNGSGKSTLLKILAGIYQPNKGNVSIKGKLVPFIELGVGFNPELSGRDNVYLNGAVLGFSKKEVDEMYESIVGFAELERFMDQKLKNYSSGMQVRLAFSMAVRANADILLVDEVLAVGDADFQRKCFNYFRELKKHKKTVVFVSHDMGTIREYCDRAILIEDSKIIATGSSNKIANKYGHLFLETLVVDDNNDEQTNKQQRWGNGFMQFSHPKCTPTKLFKNDKILLISADLKINKDLNDIIVGFSIKNSVEALVLGTNNKLLGQKLMNLKRGDVVHTEWQVPNILNDGDYYLNLSAETNASIVCDHWEEAVKISVVKNSRTGFFVSPEVKLKTERNRKSPKA
ncbi:MAG: ABC transporter ATP-binding protein [Patescibacteria group bacterium]|nr:ABC transporter ATP-binding protein [Patescibacteria group bacterium]